MPVIMTKPLTRTPWAGAVVNARGWPLGRDDQGHGGCTAGPGDGACVAHRVGRVAGDFTSNPEIWH